MAIKVAINGYGRIGRNILRAHYEDGKKHDIQFVALNDLGDAETNAHLTRYDTVDATNICVRACISVPSATARGKCSFTKRIPSIAIPSANGWKMGEQNASKLCESASIPVAAVNLGGKPTVNSGSSTTTDGNILG